ncbi:hypothetical protein CC85DRAFT_288940 [Cutaneotrichosporon oleaginosum]|uniref:Uncharacterized protein n=1 Tax=Cutaneotrichosporon oleaginosum TaxID=879819 RepID=A0A0J1AUR4_9TREE|nr:uncharacterized protein CC85DRAFT_288940 [Cutaneotrichosporon oleaginosum]KLT39019.1 hypothetical protein CC85DRAFT_288940 [Cutaneotrichosporon oleaginosum]TXT03970.1 hypothetical protein COLE_07667 [Cutaneotrichosporon oleaginosum]
MVMRSSLARWTKTRRPSIPCMTGRPQRPHMPSNIPLGHSLFAIAIDPCPIAVATL